MKKINIEKLTLLGSDYTRNTDYYLDAGSGKVYKRKLVLLRKQKQVDIVEQTVTELVDGELLYDISQQPVLSRDN